MRSIMIAAMSSGCGKTIVTAGLLMALKKRNIRVRSFKCGPDYIDPMFHTRVLGVPCRNLDLFLLGESGVLREAACKETDSAFEPGQDVLCEAGFDLAVIEGAMGFYDGVGDTEEASAYAVARLLDVPVILVVQPKGQGITLAAQIRGLMDFRPENHIAGIILNECSDSYAEYLRPVIERECGVPVFGHLPKMEEAQVKSRHLGLTIAGEIPSFKERFEAIADLMEETVDLDRILSAARSAEKTAESAGTACAGKGETCAVCRIAVARDEAFSFYYESSLCALRRAGAELVPFSPIHDRRLPADISGLYLGGGYPENFAAELSANETMLSEIHKAVKAGLPTVAECGGFMYLQEMMEGTDGRMHPMAGAIPGAAVRTPRLVRFGYVTLEASSDSMLFRSREQVHAHEFHHWDSTLCGDGLTARKQDGRSWKCGFVNAHLYAGYPHLELGGDPPLSERFTEACLDYMGRQTGEL